MANKFSIIKELPSLDAFANRFLKNQFNIGAEMKIIFEILSMAIAGFALICFAGCQPLTSNDKSKTLVGEWVYEKTISQNSDLYLFRILINIENDSSFKWNRNSLSKDSARKFTVIDDYFSVNGTYKLKDDSLIFSGNFQKWVCCGNIDSAKIVSAPEDTVSSDWKRFSYKINSFEVHKFELEYLDEYGRIITREFTKK